MGCIRWHQSGTCGLQIPGHRCTYNCRLCWHTCRCWSTVRSHTLSSELEMKSTNLKNTHQSNKTGFPSNLRCKPWPALFVFCILYCSRTLSIKHEYCIIRIIIWKEYSSNIISYDVSTVKPGEEVFNEGIHAHYTGWILTWLTYFPLPSRPTFTRERESQVPAHASVSTRGTVALSVSWEMYGKNTHVYL